MDVPAIADQDDMVAIVAMQQPNQCNQAVGIDILRREVEVERQAVTDGETPRKLTAERRSCRSHARCIGVCPEGAQVRRRTGWSMNPLSSKKTIGLPRRRAPFLCEANPGSATAPIARRRLRGPVARASDTSSPTRGALPDMSGVILHVEPLGHHVGHTLTGPKLGGVAGLARSG